MNEFTIRYLYCGLSRLIDTIISFKTEEAIQCDL